MISRMMKHRHVVLLALLSVACGSDNSSDSENVDAGVETYSISGSAVDFETGAPIQTSVTVTTDGLSPAPAVTLTESRFEVNGIPPHSVFNLLVGSPPNYRSTYGASISIETSSLNDIQVEVASEQYLSDLADELGVAPATGMSVLFVKLVDEQQIPLAGVSANDMSLSEPTGAIGPFFLDENKLGDVNAQESSSSGYVVYFNVSAGKTNLRQEGNALTIEMPISPIANTAVTIGRATVRQGADDIPTNISFRDDIVPIFDDRGCTLCHTGGGVGKDLGGLFLDGGSVNRIYKEVTEEISDKFQTPRIDIQTPLMSLMTKLPSADAEPGTHPNVTFASPQDIDFRKIQAWISAGALDN